MAIHITHDFLTNVGAVAPTANMYYLTLFLTGVLGFTRVGQTNMNIVPSVTGTVAINRGASINLGTGKEYYVQVPTSSYTVPASADNGKILVLRSVDNPKTNSGLFRVLSGSVVDNAFIIDYRTPSGSFPPIESGSLSGSIDWMLFPSEASFAPTEVYADNGAGSGYRTFGASTYPRTILRSPHPSGWQVRICAESFTDRGTFSHGFGNTVTVGCSGTIAGDWQVGVENTHGCNFWNDNDLARRAGQQGGCDPTLGVNTAWTTGQWRVYIWGDDQTGSVWFLNRNVSIGNGGMVVFGLPENEPLPLLDKVIHRLFSIGDSVTFSVGTAPTWNIGTRNEKLFTGQAFGFSGMPVSVVMSSYHMLTQNTAPRQAVTSDNPVFKATELIPVELLAGTYMTSNVANSPQAQNLPLEPRRMGFVPIARQGRSNFAGWATSSDSARLWFHTNDGVYFPWGGLAVLP